MNTIFEQMGGRYVQHGDYLIPDLTLPEEERQPIVFHLKILTQ